MSDARPGFGHRHPALAAILDGEHPAAIAAAVWAAGAMPLRIGGYVTAPEVPRDLVTSIRCIVRVGELFVLCENKDGHHVWPGGRRLPEETDLETAAREVHEETGWLIDPNSLTRHGWLCMTHIAPQADDYAYPYPDFIQLVYSATASERDGGVDAEWTDTDGYELASRLVTRDEALELMAHDAVATAFLNLLIEEAGGARD